MIIFHPVKTIEEIITEIHHIKNEQSLLKIKETNLIEELLEKQGVSDGEENS
jgi:hypothetical protein